MRWFLQELKYFPSKSYEFYTTYLEQNSTRVKLLIIKEENMHMRFNNGRQLDSIFSFLGWVSGYA